MEPTAELSPEFFADPHRFYRRWSEDGPVHRVRFPDGRVGWVVTGYAEARAALADPRLRKSGANARWMASVPGGPPMPSGSPRNTHMLDADPPDHTRLRRLVTKAFTAGAVEALRPRISEITEGLLDRMSGEVDLLPAFALPLPITVIGELLGVAEADRTEFRRLTDAMAQGPTPETVGPLMAFLSALVTTKQAAPAEDILSALIRARDDEDGLDDLELTRMAFLLLFAGHETTVNLIGNGVHALLRAPDRLAALRADPALVPAAVEEFLRHDGPVGFATLRYAGEALEIAGVEVAEGEFVHVALTAANRDPARFPDPDTLDLTRPTAGHLAFGHGIHHCLGAPLARVEGQIAFTALLTRFPRLRLADPDFTAQWVEGFRIRGLRSLPVRLE